MIDCRAARDLMLEAEPAELEGHGASELVVHFAGCAACRAAARVILEAQGELGRVLAHATPRRPSLEAAHAGARRAAGRRWMWRAAPLAAAAVLALVLAGRRAQVQWTPPPARSTAGSSVEVQAPPGRTVAVWRTNNPDIVVIWFF